MIRMLIICWIVQQGVITEGWRIDTPTEPETCWTMNRLFSTGGQGGVITVRCGEP